MEKKTSKILNYEQTMYEAYKEYQSVVDNELRRTRVQIGFANE